MIPRLVHIRIRLGIDVLKFPDYRDALTSTSREESALSQDKVLMRGKGSPRKLGIDPM